MDFFHLPPSGGTRYPKSRLARAGLVFLFALGCRAEAPPPVDAGPAPEPTPGAAEAPPAGPAANPPAIDIPNARRPWPGVLVGGQPTVEQLEAAARAGYRTIINLRAPGEQGGWDEVPKAAELGLRYEAIPIVGIEGLNAENARKLATIVDDPEALPVMVHCASGNRVGALFALKALHVDGEDAGKALAIGLEAGLTRLEGAVRERLNLPLQ